MRKSRHWSPAPQKPQNIPRARRHQELSNKALRQRQRLIDAQLKSSTISTEDAQALREQRRLIIAELAHRRRLTLRISLITAAIVILSAGGFGYYTLTNSAKRAQHNLQLAIDQNRPDLILVERARATQGLKPLIAPSLKKSIAEADDYLAALQQQLKDGYSVIAELDKQTRKWEELSDYHRRIFDNSAMKHSPEGLSLLALWEKLLKQRDKSLLSLRQEAILKINAPLPALPEWTGIREEDIAMLQTVVAELDTRIAYFHQTAHAHQLPLKYIAPAKDRKQLLAAYLLDIEGLARLEQQLAKATSYSEYLVTLRGYLARHYPLGMSLEALRTYLPDDDALAQYMGTHRAAMDEEELAALKKHINERGSSFAPEHPASAAQVAIMENIFQSSPLHSTLYQLICPASLRSWISDKAIPSTQSPSIQIKRSTLDPTYHIDSSPLVQIPTHKDMYIRKHDSQSLLKSLNISRDSFYHSAHLPSLLEVIINDKSPHCSPLVKAYLYLCIINLIEEHPSSHIMGLHFSPRLRRDIRDFRKLVEQTGITLGDQSALIYDEQHAQAEQAFDMWFRRHINPQYSAEMQRHLRSYLFTAPRYVGFIGADGTPQFLTSLSDKETLWYLTKDDWQLSAGDSHSLGEAAAFSPLFRAHIPEQH